MGGRGGGGAQGGPTGWPLPAPQCTPPPASQNSCSSGGHTAQLPGNKCRVCTSHGAPCFYFFPSLFHFIFCKNLILNSPDAIFFSFELILCGNGITEVPCILLMKQDKKAMKAWKAATVRSPSGETSPSCPSPTHTPALAWKLRCTKAPPTCIPRGWKSQLWATIGGSSLMTQETITCRYERDLGTEGKHTSANPKRWSSARGNSNPSLRTYSNA